MEWDVDNCIDFWDVDIESALPWDEDVIQAKLDWPSEGNLVGLVDADLVPYIVGFKSSSDAWFRALQKVEGIKPLSRKWYRTLLKTEECKEVIDYTNLVINSWLNRAGCDAARFYLTEGSEQYRFKIAMLKEYKGNSARKKEKPPFFQFIKKYIEVEYKASVATDCEADDLMSIEQFQLNEVLVSEGAEQGSKEAKRFSKTVIISKDKDLRMIPGWHFNPDIKNGEKFWVDMIGHLEPKFDNERPHIIKELKGTGLKFFYAQMLMGDTTDNYGGLPMCGPTAAYKLLDKVKKPKQMHKIVLDAYLKKYGPNKFKMRTWDEKSITVDFKDLFVEQGRMAWMQREKGVMFEPEHKLPRG